MKKIVVGLLGLGIVGAAFYFIFIPLYMDHYATFFSPISQPAVRFQYPKAWAIQVDQGKIQDYTQVFVKGPRNSDNSYTTMFIVRELTMGKPFKSMAELKQNRMKFVYRKAVLSDEKEMSLDANSAQSFRATQTLPPLRLQGFKPVPVNLRSWHVYAEKNQKLYEIIFNADQALFDKYAADFAHLLKTFRFE